MKAEANVAVGQVWKIGGNVSYVSLSTCDDDVSDSVIDELGIGDVYVIVAVGRRKIQVISKSGLGWIYWDVGDARIG